MMAPPTVLVFDSGLGGLTVYREIAAARPDARLIYTADDAAFPYGRLREQDLADRVLKVMRSLIEAYRPDLVVIACNTASTLVLPQLRQTFALPFVGTVPAIKPACAESRTKRVSVLGTQATVKREYTRALIRDFAQGCEVTLVGSAKLAEYAEEELHGRPVTEALIAQEIAACFVESRGARTDTVVLACTHFPLLLERLRRVAPWPVAFMDPAPAIARRVTQLLAPPPSAVPASTAPRFHFTSGRPLPEALAGRLTGFGFTAPAKRAAGFDTPPISP
jgi:glutamate racemase